MKNYIRTKDYYRGQIDQQMDLIHSDRKLRLILSIIQFIKEVKEEWMLVQLESIVCNIKEKVRNG